MNVAVISVNFILSFPSKISVLSCRCDFKISESNRRRHIVTHRSLFGFFADYEYTNLLNLPWSSYWYSENALFYELLRWPKYLLTFIELYKFRIKISLLFHLEGLFQVTPFNCCQLLQGDLVDISFFTCSILSIICYGWATLRSPILMVMGQDVAFRWTRSMICFCFSLNDKYRICTYQCSVQLETSFPRIW